MYCKNCGEHIESGAAACAKCGAEAVEEYFPRYTTELFYCKSCGAEVAREDRFCPRCAAELDLTDLIAEALNRRDRKKETPFKWVFVPEYPAKKEEGEKDEEETKQAPASASAPTPSPEPISEPKPINEQPPVQAAEETPTPAPEQIRAPYFAPPVPTPTPVPTADYYEKGAEAPQKEPAPEAFDVTSTGTAPVVPAESQTQNPDLAFTGLQRNESAPSPVYRTAEEDKEQFIPNQRGELKNYSADEEKSEPKPTIGTDVIASKPKPFKDKKALGIIAVILSVLLPPAGIILGVIAVSRGWTAMNRFYVRLGTVAIILGVVTTVAFSFAMFKWIIPALTDFINGKRNSMFLFI